MRAIFISYRRDDAEGQAGRLFDDLAQHFGQDAVFMDVAALAAGRDFRRAIEEQVASCGVLLSIIGKNWVTLRDEAGVRRLDDPLDFVRLETASALKRDIPVIPVLVQGARMPRADELPDDLKELPFRNGVELTHARWDSDLQLLITALRPFVQPRPEPVQTSPAAATDARKPLLRTGIAIILGMLVTALGGYIWYHSAGSQSAHEPAASSQARADDGPKPRQEDTQAAPTASAKRLSYRDWGGSWTMHWQFDGVWYSKPMVLQTTASGIEGDYVVGILKGDFVQGDVSKVSGEITNTTNTGTTCPSGKQAGQFLLTLDDTGRHLEGWWDVCGEGKQYVWRADKR